jgi:hypothetical protein
MEFMSIIRNRAMEILYQLAKDNNTHFDYLLFVNDIWLHVADLEELVLGGIANDYDAVCPMDYSYRFYDTLVTRDVDGNPMSSPFYPYFLRESPSTATLIKSKDTPVFSCWNGMTLFKTEPFYKHHILFRWLPENVGASECCLVFSDLHRLGFHKTFMNPRVSVVYSRDLYLYRQWIAPFVDTLIFGFAYNWYEREDRIRLNETVAQTQLIANENQLDEFDRPCLIWRRD